LLDGDCLVAGAEAAAAFIGAGWDFVGETAKGTEDIWWILEGQDNPRLWWEKTGNSKEPQINADERRFE